MHMMIMIIDELKGNKYFDVYFLFFYFDSCFILDMRHIFLKILKKNFISFHHFLLLVKCTLLNFLHHVICYSQFKLFFFSRRVKKIKRVSYFFIKNRIC